MRKLTKNSTICYTTSNKSADFLKSEKRNYNWRRLNTVTIYTITGQRVYTPIRITRQWSIKQSPG